MRTFIVERDITEIEGQDAEALAALARMSSVVVAELGPYIQWVQSYVTDGRMYCTYRAPNAELLREHARRSGLRADRIAQVRAVIDPSTGAG
jgi:hypothetical protein